MRALLIALLAMSGCSLIIDVDQVREQRDAGSGNILDAQQQPDAATARDADPADEGQAADASEPDAAEDAGFPDAMNPCTRPDTGVLNCSETTFAVTAGGTVALDGDGASFFGAYVIAGGIYVFRSTPPSAPTQVAVFNTVATPIDLSIAARDGEYALAWIEAGDRSVHCRTSIQTSSASRMTVDEDIVDVSIALAPSGAISVVTTEPFFFTTAIFDAESPLGCPAQLSRRAPFYYTRGVATAWIESRSVFRYSLTAIHPNLEDSGLLIHDVTGQNIRVYVYTGLGIRGVAHAPTANGQYLVQMFGYGDAASQSMTITAHSTDLMTINAPDRVLSMNATNFDMTPCGAGCIAGAILSDEANGRISSAFFSDDLSLRWFNESMFDVACNLSAFGSDLDIGYAAGKLGFLYSDGTRATLYLCDKPF